MFIFKWFMILSHQLGVQSHGHLKYLGSAHICFPPNSSNFFFFQPFLVLKTKSENLYLTTETDLAPALCDLPFQYENKHQTNTSDSLFSPKDRLAHLAKIVYITSLCVCDSKLFSLEWRYEKVFLKGAKVKILLK